MRLIDAEQVKQIVHEYIDRTGSDVFTYSHIAEFLDKADSVYDGKKLYNGRFAAVETNHSDLTVGRIYVVKDGKFKDDAGNFYPSRSGDYISDFHDLVAYLGDGTAERKRYYDSYNPTKILEIRD